MHGRFSNIVMFEGAAFGRALLQLGEKWICVHSPFGQMGS
ncbi:hypothetical protein APY04_1510 [Hyphomicrobium sulfonivorans]|uniref:Uncharacterized protein n=1 Tax=Hyphomicrobium sulfonivorans TaxID=121290 RepID=A0A109BII8_HYPSL|nr:hypothetical protein APY04_1510 [Hyphomicrobium sulfonivorans]